MSIALDLYHYFGDHEDLYISSSLFYFSFVIDNAKSTSLDCENSNIYSCILSLLKLTKHSDLWIRCVAYILY